VAVCVDCGSSFATVTLHDPEDRCGNCNATKDLPRCGRPSSVAVLGVTAPRCQRAAGHTGHHTYGRKRA
jgi:hypothetical protein